MIYSESLSEEDSMLQADFFTSPTKWHLAHTTWFFEEMILKQYVSDYEPFDPLYGFLFNSYYNNVGNRTLRGERGLISRPGLKEVYEYRKSIEDEVVEYLSQDDVAEETYEILQLGIQHEQQHQELLLTDLKYCLSFNPGYPVYREDLNLTQQVNNVTGFVVMQEGMYEIGHDGSGFSFDNEHVRHQVFLHEFEISKSLVTNGEYLAFMDAGGYKDFNFWLDEGWSWIQENEIHSPLYWVKKNDIWYHYTLSGLKEIKPNEILSHINYYEASAYASWKGMRLPTEFEWEAACEGFNWGRSLGMDQQCLSALSRI